MSGRARGRRASVVTPVVAAALRLADGRIYTGVSHLAAMDALYVAQRGAVSADTLTAALLAAEDGFVDAAGHFLTRTAAYRRARRAGQPTTETFRAPGQAPALKAEGTIGAQ